MADTANPALRGAPYDVVALDTRNRANERLIQHLNVQLEHLQRHTGELEASQAELEKRLSSEYHRELELDERVNMLTTELNDAQTLITRLQESRDEALKAAERERNELNREIEKDRIELQRLDTRIGQLEKERKQLIGEVQQLTETDQTLSGDKIRLEGLVRRLTSDKVKLAQRISKLTSNERALVLEIERLKLKGGARRAQSPNRVDAYMRGIEEDRDYYKAECELLHGLLSERDAEIAAVLSTPGGARARSPTRKGHKRTPSAARAAADSDSGFESRAREEVSGKADRVAEMRKQLNHYEAMIKSLESELAVFKRAGTSTTDSGTRARSPVRPTTPPTRDSLEGAELTRLRHENEELRLHLGKFERSMDDVRANLNVIQSERDKVRDLYDESRKEVSRLRTELLGRSSPSDARDSRRSAAAAVSASAKMSSTAQAILRRVEAERDDSLAEIRRLSSDRDALQERLRSSTEAAVLERSHAEERLAECTAQHRRTEQERNELLALAESQKTRIASLEKELSGLLRAQGEAERETRDSHQTASQMRVVADEASRLLDESKRRLQLKELEVDDLTKKLLTLEGRLRSIETDSRATGSELQQARVAFASSERERDKIRVLHDAAEERVRHLETELKARDSAIIELRSRLNSTDAQANRSNELLASRERDLGTLRAELERLTNELGEQRRSREAAERDAVDSRTDSDATARENAGLRQEVRDLMAEMAEYKQQVQTYTLEVKRIQDALAAKEQERSDLLEQYRTLSLEADRYQSQSHQFESEASNFKLQLKAREVDVRNLKDQVDKLERELDEHRRTQASYESQVATLSKSVQQLEDLLRHNQLEKDEVMRDLQAVRELNSRLEASREQIQRQLSMRLAENDQLVAKNEATQGEIRTLREQLALDADSIRNLESLLQSTRDRVDRSARSEGGIGTEDTTGLITELSLARERETIGAARLDAAQREVAELRARNLHLEGEVTRTRLRTSTEHLERASDMRRSQTTLVGPGAAAGRISPSYAAGLTSPTSLPGSRAISPPGSQSFPQRRSSNRNDQ